MRHKRTRLTGPREPAFGSRRQFLGYSGAVVGASILGPMYSRSALAQSASSFDYYISSTGSDSNPGTQASPWALTALNTKQSTYAGHRVGVLPGTYNCLSLIGGSYGSSFSTPAFNIAGGSASSPTVIQSTTARGAILDGGATASNNPAGQPLIGTIGSTAGAGYITLDGFEIKNGFNRLVSIGYETGAMEPSQRLAGIIVQNCYVHTITNNIAAANTTAITLYSCDGALVQNNYITDVSDSTNRATGIEIWTSINCITQYNTVISLSSQQFGGIQHKNQSQQNNTIRYNYINMAAAGTGGGMTTPIGGDSDGSSATTFSIYNNIVVADQVASPAIIQTGQYPSSQNNQLWYNNTFVGIPNNSIGCWERFGAARTISFYNNIISRGTTGGRGDVDTNASALKLIDYNCYPSNPSLGVTPDGSTAYPSSLASSLAAWAAALGTGASGRDAHSVTGSPMFVASGSGPGYYQLQSGSPCKGKGSTNGTSGGSATDMGAWGNGATQIGCSFAPGAAAVVVPDPPQLIGVS